MPQTRLIVLTDFFKDPDDQQSMIRLLTSANEFRIEGIVATSLAYGDGSVRPEWIRELIDHYGRVLENLRLHERPGYTYPSAESLKRKVKRGAPVIRKHVGRNKGFFVPYPQGGRDRRSCERAEHWIGPGHDSAGSEHIIRVVGRDDDQPVWVVVWGGAMDLAQALWKVRHERTPEEANHHPVVHLQGDSTRAAMHRNVASGSRVTLDATGTRDPDGDQLTYRWWQYVESGSYPKAVGIQDANAKAAHFVDPTVDASRTVHIILSVTDQGSPPLTTYRRAVVTVTPSKPGQDR